MEFYNKVELLLRVRKAMIDGDALSSFTRKDLAECEAKIMQIIREVY
jgi:hypothetical protein